MKIERNIGKEILEGLKEIRAWQKEGKKLKIIQFVTFPDASDIVKISYST